MTANQYCTPDDLIVGKEYRSKRYGQPNRIILWRGGKWSNKTKRYEDSVQYDSDSITQGRHYPYTTVEAFLKWTRGAVNG